MDTESTHGWTEGDMKEPIVTIKNMEWAHTRIRTVASIEVNGRMDSNMARVVLLTPNRHRNVRASGQMESLRNGLAESYYDRAVLICAKTTILV